MRRAKVIEYSTANATMEFVDPHFHIWDLTLGIHDTSKLFAPRGISKYTYAAYEEDLAGVDGLHVKLVGGCFVEAMSVCFPDTPAAELQVEPHHRDECLYGR